MTAEALPTSDISRSAATDAAGDSMTVAAWTVISRITGVARIAAIGAVLGPTFFGNTFQFTNSLPNLIYYGFLAGAMFSSLLVPALVRSIDAGDRRGSERVAGGFLGITVVALAVIAPVAVLLAPVVLRLAALGAADTSVGIAQERIGRLLIIMFIPQVLFYGIIGTATAVQNAHRRFGLAAAAPALENVGIIAVLLIAAAIYGTGSTLDPPPGLLLLLGLGTTAAVALHAAAQWCGAKRSGVVLVPRAGWRDPEVRTIVRRALPALGQTALVAVQVLAVLLVSNRIAGGVVAFQIGLNFFFLAVALGSTPVSLSLLPRLARMHSRREDVAFKDTFVRGMAIGLFVTVPAAVGLLVLSTSLARAVSFGQMGSVRGVELVTFAIVGLSLAVISQTGFEIAMYASYARNNSQAPFRAMLVQAGTCLTLLSGALLLHGSAVLLAAGLAYSISILIAAAHLNAGLRRRLPGSSERLRPSLVRIAVGSAVMAIPVYAIAAVVPSWIGGQFGAWVGLLSAMVAGVVTYGCVQVLCRSPEIKWAVGGFRQLIGRHSSVLVGPPHG